MILISDGDLSERGIILISKNPNIEVLTTQQAKELLSNPEQTAPTEFIPPPMIIKPLPEYKYFTPPITRTERRKQKRNKTK